MTAVWLTSRNWAAAFLHRVTADADRLSFPDVPTPTDVGPWAR